MSAEFIDAGTQQAEYTPSSNRLDQLPVTIEQSAPIEVQSYYRSRTFAALSGVNPLVSSCAALFSLVPRLRQSKRYTNIPSLYQHLIHEIKAFESTAIRHHYPTTTVWIARYLLCSLFDDTLLHTEWGRGGTWNKCLLISTYLHEEFNENRFYVIVKGLMKDPKQYIDLIEFAYICLSIGYLGKYRNHPQGHEQIAKITSQLYQVIRHHRGDFPKELTNLKSNKKERCRIKHFSFLGMSFITLVFLTVLYTGFNYLLTTTHTPLNNQLSAISKMIYSIDDDY